jgi:hypothetical protein
MNKGIQYAGTIGFAAEYVYLYNRTGGATVVGGVYAIDVSRVQAESTDAASAMSNATPVAAANIDGILVIADQIVADNEIGRFIVNGPALALVDGGTTDVLVGDKLIAAAASTSLVKSGATTDVVHAIAIDGNTGTAALKTVYWLGGWSTRPGTAS